MGRFFDQNVSFIGKEIPKIGVEIRELRSDDSTTFYECTYYGIKDPRYFHIHFKVDGDEGMFSLDCSTVDTGSAVRGFANLLNKTTYVWCTIYDYGTLYTSNTITKTFGSGIYIRDQFEFKQSTVNVGPNKVDGRTSELTIHYDVQLSDNSMIESWGARYGFMDCELTMEDMMQWTFSSSAIDGHSTNTIHFINSDLGSNGLDKTTTTTLYQTMDAQGSWNWDPSCTYVYVSIGYKLKNDSNWYFSNVRSFDLSDVITGGDWTWY